MRQVIASEHLNFFRRERYIFFESLWSSEQLAIANQPLPGLQKWTDPLRRYKEAHDTFRQDTALRSLILKKKWAEIGASLFQDHPLILAYTQYLLGTLPFSDSVTLSEISSFSSLVGGLLINLETGDGTYIASDCPLSRTGWLSTSSSLLLIAYMSPESRYILLPQDPCTHFLKTLGYGFGDRPENETHPLLLN